MASTLEAVITNGYLNIVDTSQLPAYVKVSVPIPSPNLQALIYSAYYPDFTLSATTPSAIPGLSGTMIKGVWIHNIGSNGSPSVGIYDSTGSTKIGEIAPGGYMMLYNPNFSAQISAWTFKNEATTGTALVEILVFNA